MMPELQKVLYQHNFQKVYSIITDTWCANKIKEAPFNITLIFTNGQKFKFYADKAEDITNV